MKDDNDLCYYIELSLGAENILLGDVKVQHEFIWSLVLHYSLKRATSSTLLDMINQVIAPIEVSNFTTDWVDGKALQALVLSLSNAKSNIVNSNTASDGTFLSAVYEAERVLSIPPLIIPEMLPSLSQRSLIIYLSLFITPFFTLINTWLLSQLPSLNIPEQLEEWLDGCVFQALLHQILPILFTEMELNRNYLVKYKRQQEQIQFFSLTFKRIEHTLGLKCPIDPTKLVKG